MLMRTDAQRSAWELRESNNLTWNEIGAQLGVSRKTARKLYDEWLNVKPHIAYLDDNVISIERFKPIEVQGNAIVSCDWHIPLHSPRMINSLLEKAHKNDIKQLIIAGDYLNLDVFSHFLPHQPEAKFEVEREAATKILDVLLDVFDNVTMSWGNHEHRIAKFVDFKLSFEYCMRWILSDLPEDKLNRVKFSELDHIIYRPGPLDLRIGHQTNFSKIPLTVPRQLAQKYNMSILSAHSHHFAQGVALDGKNLIFEGGGLFDPERTAYIQRTNLHHQWVQGFYLWQDGICYPYSPIYNNL